LIVLPFFSLRIEFRWLHPVPAVDEEVTLPSLAPREREIVQLVAEGKSAKEVASHLEISVKTAETHRSNIMRKLSLHSVAEVVLYAVKNHMAQVASPPSDLAI
jgi:DNA-binding NarL/FixJ family response regulator